MVVADELHVDEIVERINQLHSRIQMRGAEMVELAISIGRDLLATQRVVEPGLWRSFFHQHFSMHITTAERYMRIAEHADIVRTSKAMGIEDAMQIIKEEPRRGHGPVAYSSEAIAEMIELAGRIGVKPAARELGVSPSTVHKHLSSHAPGIARRQTRILINDEAIERVAEWLCAHIREYPPFPNLKVRGDARSILVAAKGDT